ATTAATASATGIAAATPNTNARVTSQLKVSIGAAVAGARSAAGRTIPEPGAGTVPDAGGGAGRSQLGVARWVARESRRLFGRPGAGCCVSAASCLLGADTFTALGVMVTAKPACSSALAISGAAVMKLNARLNPPPEK